MACCQLRFAYVRWGTPMKDAGKKWAANNPTHPLSISAQDRNRSGMAPPQNAASFSDAAAAVGNAGTPFPNAWGGQGIAGMGITVPPPPRLQLNNGSGVKLQFGGRAVAPWEQSPGQSNINSGFAMGMMLSNIQSSMHHMAENFNRRLDALQMMELSSDGT